MDKTPDIAVIIPVYNTAEYLPDCMNSVLESRLKNIEIILVDDGSTDGKSPALCDEYANKDSRVRVIHKENGGLQSAWIAGVKDSTANYLCFIDSDDWVDSEMFEELFSHTSQAFKSCEIISSDYIIEKQNERKEVHHTISAGQHFGENLDNIKTRLLGQELRTVILSRCMKLTSRKLIINNLKYCDSSIRLGEDVNIMIPALCDCKRLYVSDVCYYHYRTVADSMAHGHNEKMLDNIKLLCDTCCKILTDKKITNAKEQADMEYLRLMFVYVKDELRARYPEAVATVSNTLKEDTIKNKIKNNKLEVSNKANKLIYFGMRHPSKVMLKVIQLILLTYDKKTN
ncbi:MAG: glycosyltransferase [Butyrivibrio sp.]|uniref:glycosyltransferase family 2 protein n=1 Tax=Butyrivibrio sp. TaxID=28121 RepID=UPI0025D734BD|nr:glycosyltransferase family 2 protein [Butyrivibrio sp.]MCR5770135.1 glycosyltransferase [Butyrivibrio sp.]